MAESYHYRAYWYDSVVRWWAWSFAPVAVSVAVRREYICKLLELTV